MIALHNFGGLKTHLPSYHIARLDTYFFNFFNFINYYNDYFILFL